LEAVAERLRPARPLGALLCLALLFPAAQVDAQSPELVDAQSPARGDAQAPARVGVQAPARVYGIEVETRGDTQRLLVFADGEVEPRLEEPDPDRLILVLPRAALDSTAPTRVRPSRGGALRLVVASEQRRGDAPEVRLEIRRSRGAKPTLERRGSAIALSFEGGAPSERVSISFDGEQLAEVVDKIAKVVGQSFIYDEKLQGRVSIASTEPVTPEEARAILDTVLLLEGWAALPTPAGPYKVVPINSGMGSAPFRRHPDDEDSEALVTTFLRLKSVDASSIVSTLKPWLGRYALAVALPETNGLILAADEHRLHQLLRMLRILDQAAGEELVVRRLRHRGAEEMAEVLKGLAGDDGPARDQLEIWTDERTSTILLRAPPERLEQLRKWIAQLDRPPPAEGGLHVYRVRFADPEALAALMNDIGSQAGGQAPGTPAGAPLLSSGSFTVVADPPSNSLVIRADPEVYTVVLDLLDELDVLPPRIEVEVVVLEVATDSSLSLGVDAFIPLANAKAPDDWIAGAFLDPTGSGLLQPGAGAGPSFAARFARSPLLIPILDPEGNPLDVLIPRETVVVLADESEVASRVLLRPHLSMLSGEEHQLTAGDNIPIPTAAVSEGAGASFQQRTNIVRQDVGVTLRVRPTVGLAGRVRLELEVEATRVGASVAGDVEVVGPTIEQRVVQSNFWLSDNEIAVVGLGRFPESASIEVGTPWLRDIPFLGWLFKAVRERRMDAHLLVTAQARILESDGDVIANTIRRRLALKRILSREGHLVPEDGPYALRVATRSVAEDAEAIAASLVGIGERTRVVSWEWQGVTHWDVYVVGIEKPGDIPDASLRASSEGWTPELVVVDDGKAPS
jgi:general secretion pathway protein D